MKKIAGKSKHMLALSEDGRVFGWGSNEWGQMGLGPEQPTLASQLYDHHMPLEVQGMPAYFTLHHTRLNVYPSVGEAD